mgnify:CR=1 FL=1
MPSLTAPEHFSTSNAGTLAPGCRPLCSSNFDSVLRSDQPLTALLTADYTYANEKVAKHYGIGGVTGTQFRRVTLPQELDMRRGLLGKGALLTVTSNAARSSVHHQWKSKPPARPVAFPARSRGEVAFDNVNFSYPTRPETAALHNVSFQIRAGEKVAIVGPSGAGKSTIFHLILRFYDPTSGVVAAEPRPYESFFPNGSRPSEEVVTFVNEAARKRGAKGFDLKATVFPVELPGIDKTVRAMLASAVCTRASAFSRLMRAVNTVI